VNSEASASDVFSLWLIPQGRVRKDLENLITELSVQYATPKFEPHVTLIGELAIPEQEAVTKTRCLSKMLKPFTISLKKVACLGEYFRCVFIKADKTEGLMNAHQDARALFKQEEDDKYMPHLSLVYGDLTLPQKEQIIKNIGQETRVNFKVDRITLYYTCGQPQNWYRILETPLTDQNRDFKP
jgi:2'-5' RNA ligase